MDKYLRKLTTVAKTHPDNVKSSSKSNSDIEIIEEKENIKQQIETKKCKVVLTRLNSKNKAIAEDQMDVDAKEQEHKTPEVQLDDTIEDEDTNEDVAKSVVNLASKDPSTPVGNTVKPGMASLSSSKKTKTPKSEAERQLANQTRLENLKKKEEEQRKREEARLKQEEERRKRKAEEEERKAERLKVEEERRKRKAEEEERKAENRRKMEELRQKREEEKLKREEEKIKQMEEKLEREKEVERQRLEKLEKERVKNEEKRLKEEEKAREEEEKQRKAALVKNKFAQFFTKVDVPKSETDENQKMYRFMSFQVKANMSQAPINRRPDINDFEEFKQKMDEALRKCRSMPEEQLPNYLKEIRANPKLIRRVKTSCRKSKKAKIIKISDYLNNEDESVMSIEEIKSSLDTEVNEVEKPKTRVKYLHFDKTECKRPPYYGTWRKESKKIRPRNPFVMDEKLIDYEVDSDEEWEDIADAESIGDSDKDEEEEKLNGVDDEEDDGFLVPHGHLSDDELEEDERMINPEERKIREAAKTEQWETERKKTTKNIIPKCYFIENYWNGPNPSLDTAKHTKHINHLERLQIMPFLQDFSASLFPMNIITDQKLEQDKLLKQANDEAAKKAKVAAAKEAAAAEAAANASPTTTTPKTKLKKKNSDNGQNNSPLVTGISSNATTTPVATTSILKFVSKMSNKNIDAKPMNSESSTDKIEIIGSKPPLPMNKIANSPLPVNKATNANNSPLALNKVANSPLTMSKVVNSPLTINKATNSPLQLSKVVGSPIGNQKNGTFNTPNNKPKSQSRKSLLGSPALQTTPQSSPLVHNNTTAEKRTNNFSEENVVKRMKYEEVNSENAVNTPTIKSLFMNSPCQKNLNKVGNQLNSSVSNSPAQSPAIKKVLGPARRNSIDGIASKLLAEASSKVVSSDDNSNSQMETESSVEIKNKENTITID